MRIREEWSQANDDRSVSSVVTVITVLPSLEELSNLLLNAIVPPYVTALRCSSLFYIVRFQCFFREEAVYVSIVNQNYIIRLTVEYC
jgi:hypothetical protein